jgi:hypothetical protein
MLKQPLVMQFVPGLGPTLVLESLWGFFSTRDQAEAILPKVRAVVPDAEIYDSASEFGQPFMYLDQVTRLWAFRGKAPFGDVSLNIKEAAGWLFDRQEKPQPFVDTNPDTSLGGPFLAVSNVGNGFGQLHWQKADPAAGKTATPPAK